MRKNFLAPPNVGIVCIFSFLLLFIYSCKKDIQESEKQKLQEEIQTVPPIEGGDTPPCVETLENYNINLDSVEYPTTLGSQLIGNPYSVSVMQQAAINLYGNSNGISVNKKYIRFRPTDEWQISQLLDLELELFDYPLDREVIVEGDYYNDPNVSGDPWLYTVVDPGFQPPAGITYEWLADLHVPDLDIWLEEEALRITGNPVEDSCNGADLPRLPDPCEDPNDPTCGSGGGGGGGGGSSPDIKVPAGNIEVWDSNLGDNVAVRRTRVVARRWFKIETVYTDDQGHFQCTKRFSNKVNVFVKFHNNHLLVSPLFGNSIIKALLPIKRGLGIYSGNLRNIHHVFERGPNPQGRIYRHWWAAQLMNAYLEYNEMAAAEQIGGLPTQRMKIVLTRWGHGAGVTTMASQRLNAGIPSGEFFQHYFADIATSMGSFYFNLLLNGVLFRSLDMGLSYRTGVLWESNRVKDLMYHEMTHAAHFNKVGDNWWNDLVMAESFTITANFGVNSPYGDGSDGPHSEIISVAESWAEHVAEVFSNIQYGGLAATEKFKQGIVYTINNPVNNLGAHLNAIEDFSPNRGIDPHRWIPEGIYYDLIDNRNDNAIDNTLPIDNATGYTMAQCFNALDIDIRSMPQYRQRFLSENGFNQTVVDLFSEYHY
jgi:hypothetical protein